MIFFLTFIRFSMTGMDDPSRPFMTLQKALNDDKRIRYHRDYLSNLSAAIKYSINIVANLQVLEFRQL